MAINPRGGGDIDQMRLDFLSGGTAAEQFATTDAPPKTDLHLAMWLSGNVVDSGMSAGDSSDSSGVTVNGPPTFLVNSVGVSWDDVVFVNGI
jgi:hypothetical protein